MKKGIKGSIASALLGCVGASVIGLAVGCTARIDNTVFSGGNGKVSITTLQTPTSATTSSGQTIKISQNTNNPSITKITATSNPFDLPSRIAYNSDKSVACVIYLITENQALNQKSRSPQVKDITWNSLDKCGEVQFVGNTNPYKLYNSLSSTTDFLFELNIVNPPANVFTQTNYYFVISCFNPT